MKGDISLRANSNRPRFPRLAAVGISSTLMAGLAVVATTAGASGATVPRASADGTSAPTAAAPRVPALSWRSCDDGFQCATARVPLDYRHPRGATIRIAVIRHLAARRAQPARTLLVNAGGPVEQIEPLVGQFSAIPAALRARFNIVTFDMRGFGLSSAVRCFPNAAAENKLLVGLPPFPVGARQVAVWEKTWARFDARCARKNGSLLRHDTSTDVARDMNLLRQAMGIRKLNYLGLSYATGLGAVYANLFPAAVGHMVLDGNLNPVAWSKGGSLPDSLREGEDLAAASVMRSFLNLCGTTTTSACAFSAGTAAATRAKFAALLHRLLRHPVTVGNPPQTFTYADTVSDVPPRDVSDWQGAGVLLQQLWAASTENRAPAAVPTAGQSTAEHGIAEHTTTTPAVYAGLEQTYAEFCADTADPRGTRAYEAAARLAAAHAGGFGLDLTWTEEPCAAWPATASHDRYKGPWNHRTASPILVIGNTGDPVTPYRSAVAMSRALARARLLTVHGFGHTEFFNPSTCATNYEVSYLETGALPPSGTGCQQDATPFPAP
jgi:pimeloyl-ACP methyl ester carboxylesterase